MTATCLVSQHWPPHIYSHLLPPSLFPSLHLSSSLVLSLGIWSVTLLLFLRPPSPFSPSFNYFYLTFFLSLSNAPTPCWRYTYSLTLLGRLRGSRVREVWRETGERGGRKEKIRPPPLPLSEGCVLNPYIVHSPEMARNSFCTVTPLSYIGGGILHSQEREECKLNSFGAECVGHSCIYIPALCRRHFKKQTG